MNLIETHLNFCRGIFPVSPRTWKEKTETKICEGWGQWC